MLQEAELVEQLSCLKVYRDFEQAFYQVTELSVRLRTLGMWNLACALLNEEGRFCSTRQAMQSLIHAAQFGLGSLSVEHIAQQTLNLHFRMSWGQKLLRRNVVRITTN